MKNIKCLTIVSAFIVLFLVVAIGCGQPKAVVPVPEPNEVDRYAKQLNLPEQVRAIVRQLDYGDNTKALIDGLCALPQKLHIHEVTLNYLKEICGDKTVTNDELAGLKKLDHDNDGLDLEEERGLGTDPLKPNPNVKYALGKGLTTYADQIKPMDEDGEQDESEKASIDLCSKILQLGISKPAMVKNIHYILSGKTLDVNDTYDYLSTVSGRAVKEMLEFGLDDSVVKYTLFVSSLGNKDFAKYALENKLCIQDRNLTDLEKEFLRNPNAYLNDLFDHYDAEINRINPELARELKKVPDLKQASVKNIEAMEDIITFVTESKNEDVIQAMLSEGIRDKRKYSTPLQALVWIAYDDEDLSFASNDRVSELVFIAWGKTSASKAFKSDRWQNFDEVTDRLNSPSLITLYMSTQLTYDIWRSRDPLSASSTFSTKKGVCTHMANFATYLLVKNGFEAYHLRAGQINPKSKVIQGRSVESRGHSVALYKEDSLFYFINGPYPGSGAFIEGPFTTIENAARKVCTDSGYTFEWYSLFKPDEPVPVFTFQVR